MRGADPCLLHCCGSDLAIKNQIQYGQIVVQRGVAACIWTGLGA